MRNARKVLALLLAVMMTLTCFVGLSVGSSAKAGDPAFTVEFREYSDDAVTDNKLGAATNMTFDPKTIHGYISVEIGADASLKLFADNAFGGMTGDKVGYMVMKYRYLGAATTGTVSTVEYALVNDGTWQTVLVDGSAAWGKADADLSGFTMTLANGAGDMDISYIAFFGTKAEAEAAVAKETTTNTVGGVLSAASTIFEIAGKKYVTIGAALELTADNTDASGTTYEIDGFRVFLNGNDTGMAFRTATNGKNYLTNGAMAEVREVSARESALEIDGKFYLYENKIEMKALYLEETGVKNTLEAPEGRTNGDELSVVYAGDTSTTVIHKADVGTYVQAFINGGGAVHNSMKEVERILFHGWIDMEANWAEYYGKEFVACGYVVDGGEFVEAEGWMEKSPDIELAIGSRNALAIDMDLDVSDWENGDHYISIAFKDADGNVYAFSECNNLRFIKYSTTGEGEPAKLVDNDGKTPDQFAVTGVVDFKDGSYGFFTGLRDVSETIEVDGKSYAYASRTEVKYVSTKVENEPVANKTPMKDYSTQPEEVWVNIGSDSTRLVKFTGSEDLKAWAGNIYNVIEDKYGEYDSLTFKGWTCPSNAGAKDMEIMAYGYEIAGQVYISAEEGKNNVGEQVLYDDGRRMSVTVPLADLEPGVYIINLLYMLRTKGQEGTEQTHAMSTWSTVKFYKYSTADNMKDADGNLYTITDGVVSKNGVATENNIAEIDGKVYYIEGKFLPEEGKEIIDMMPPSYAYKAVVSETVAPKKATRYYTATFVDEAGNVVQAVRYAEGTLMILTPDVPAKEGYTGVWENYTLTGDITIRPVYTPVGGTDVTETETTANVSETDTTGSDDGCGSVIAAGSIAVVLSAVAAAVVLKKKED